MTSPTSPPGTVGTSAPALAATAEEPLGKRVRRRLAKWLMFGVVVAALPLIINAVTSWTNSGTLSKLALLGDGELFLVAAGLAAGGLGDLVMDRRNRDGRVTTTQGFLIGATLLIALLGAAIYSEVTGDDSGSSGSSPSPASSQASPADSDLRAANLSIVVFVSALAASGACVAMTETP